MSAKPTGHGYIFVASGAWHTRFNIRVKGKRVAKCVRICTKDAEHGTKESVLQLAKDIVKQAQAHATNQEQTFLTAKCPTCGRFTKGAKQQ
jgi:hypothetical protein